MYDFKDLVPRYRYAPNNLPRNFWELPQGYCLSLVEFQANESYQTHEGIVLQVREGQRGNILETRTDENSRFVCDVEIVPFTVGEYVLVGPQKLPAKVTAIDESGDSSVYIVDYYDTKSKKNNKLPIKSISSKD